MNNQITASVEFYFKGKKIAASIELDLDKHMQAAGSLPDIYPLLASAANLDLYSYEYEVMQMEPVVFQAETGLARDFIRDGQLDLPALEQAWKENDIIEKLQQIARQHLSSEDLTQEDALKEALLAAYRLGKKSR